MWYFLFGWIIFNLFISLYTGGVRIRSVYAYKVSDSFVSFFKNYALSYLLNYNQMQSSLEYFPEINNKLEKYLCNAIADLNNNKQIVGYSKRWHDDHFILRIQRNGSLDNSHGTIEFQMQTSKLNSSEYLFSPIVFILGDRILAALQDGEEKERIEKKRTAI